MFKMMGLAQKSWNYVQNNGIGSKRQNYKEWLGKIKQERQCWHQDLVHCTGWPVCTLRILWHSDGSCRGIPPRHLNSDIQPLTTHNGTFLYQGTLFVTGDLDTDSRGQILNAGQVAGRLGRKNTRTTSIYCVQSFNTKCDLYVLRHC